MIPVKRITVCADDFGLSEEVNCAIVELAMLGRLTAVSVLSGGSISKEHVDALVALNRQKLDLGLHLNLTEQLQVPSSVHRSLGFTIVAAYTRRLDPWGIREQIHCQLEQFETRFARKPDYVDGHQHVHLLPGVRESLITVLRERYGDAPTWVRCCRSSKSMRQGSVKLQMKAQLLEFFERTGATTAYRSAGLPRNRRLLGLNDYSDRSGQFSNRLHHWLQACENGDLIMVHPSIATVSTDPLREHRRNEYETLKSQEFFWLLEVNDQRLDKMSDILSDEDT